MERPSALKTTSKGWGQGRSQLANLHEALPGEHT